MRLESPPPGYFAGARSPLMPRTKVSFQGERGAFSEEACRHFLGDKVSFLPKGSFEEVFQSSTVR